ncbi:D-glycero-alpha-D-manno-heptose-1,7-bisphosphate 7-phosphatase [Novosphingobium sp.]|uniref:D-glycero-alpha-D-manno-heptose-1,7-bisphosphate 7-phosphatase n=1 Tax=Novosphingobium sp. TaxID=1874826 RepID=UPI0035B3118F
MTFHPEPGTFAMRFTPGAFAGSPCLFLDRDGVVVEETNYLHRIDDVRFIPGVAQAVARINAAGLPVVMVTNQAGIGRGYYSWSEFMAVQQHIYDHYAQHGAHFDMVLACAYHEDGREPYAVARHPWRKPEPGMLLHAAGHLQVDLPQSYIVGDAATDLRAGQAAGLAAGAMVLTGHGQREWQAVDEDQLLRWSGSGFKASRQPDAAHAIAAWRP